jgi:hypothetical protein
MIKRLLIAFLAVMLVLPLAASELARKSPPRVDRIITGLEPLPPGPEYPLNPGLITQSPGIQVGTTHYDYQSNGSSGNRVAVTNDGSKYFAWMNGLNYPRPRHIYFNWVDAAGNWFSSGEGDRVNNDSVGGYCQLSLIYGNRGAIAYHGPAPAYTKLAIDSDPPGFGIWNYYDPPDLITPGNTHGMWPYIAVDRNNRIHILMTESTTSNTVPQRMVYTRSTDGGVTWVNPVRFVDTVKCIAGVVAASPVSDKVIVTYSKMTDTSSQTWNDIVYVLSQDGLTWDFINGRVNVTNYGSDSDSLWAYTDLDVIFDYNDNFHIIWNANWSPTANSYYYRTYLFHYNHATQVIDEVRTPYPDSVWPQSGCDFGGWNRAVCKMNLGVQEGTNTLFATWTQFDTADCSAGGFANGDIWMSSTSNGGTSWETPINLTNSPTPGCFAGDCDSDHWSTLADKVDDALHILYVNDKDAGGLPQTEGANTENPMLYLRVPVSSIDDQPQNPANFSLAQNYPNPFNAKTIISYELKESSPVKVEVFDITGAKVATLVNQTLSAGHHQVSWDATNYASGVYYYKLTTKESSQAKQMVLIK